MSAQSVLDQKALGPARLSHRHEAVMRVLVENPEAKLGDIALLLGYTQAWLSCIIHSDAFQAELRRRQDDLWQDTRLTIRDKLEGLAHAGLERMAERLDDPEVSLAQARETTAMVLENLGFTPARGQGTPPSNVVQLNFNNVAPEVYQRARERLMGGASAGDSPSLPAPAAEELPTSTQSLVGTADPSTFRVPAPPQGLEGLGPPLRAEGEESPGDDPP